MFVELKLGNMKFEFNYKSFYRRITIPLLFVLIIIGSLDFIISLDIYLKLILSIFFITVYSTKLYFSNKYYITSILLEENFITIQYYIHNTKRIKVIKYENFIIYFGNSPVSNTLEKTLIFKENNKNIIIQYQRGEWKKEKMIELVDCIIKMKRK